MARKLQPDEIKWILSLDAKGVQSELVGLSSKSDDLTKKNKDLDAEMKKVSKSMNEAEKDMQRLENRGDTTSQTYQRAKTSFDQNSVSVQNLSKQIDANKKSIDDNDVKAKELIRTLKIEDMTTGQLEKRAKELEIQLKKTAQSTSPEAYKALDKELETVRGRMGELNKGGKDTESMFPGLSGTAIKAMASIGIAVAAAKKGFDLFEDVMLSNRGTAVEFTAVMDGLSASFDYFKTSVANWNFEGFWENAKNAFDAGSEASKMFENVHNMQNSFKLTSAPEIAEIEELKTQLRDVNISNKERLSIGDQIIERTNKLADQEKKVYGEGLKAAKRKLDSQAEFTDAELDFIIVNRNAQEDNLENLKQIGHLEKDLTRFRANANTWEEYSNDGKNNFYIKKLEEEKKNIEKYKSLIENRKKAYGFEDASQYELMSSAVKKFANTDKKAVDAYVDARVRLNDIDIKTTRSLRMTQRQISTLTKKENDPKAGERKQKEDLTTDLTNLETAHKEELQILKDAKIAKKQTDEQYKIEVAKSDKQYYADRIKLLDDYKEQVSDKKMLADIDKDIVDAKGKSQDLDPIIDKANLDTLSKSRDEMLRMASVGTNGLKLEQEKREENDKVHTLRLQTIELTAAQNRLEILRGYGKQLEETEVADAKLKEDMVRASGDAIIQAETDTILKRKALDKTYKNSNDAVRNQYGLVSISEQLANEKAIQDAWRKENLISEETYQQAIEVIERKYADKKLDAREQYGIASVQEIYNRDLEELRLKLEQELLTEEEFAQAKGQLKLKYATEIAQKINQLTGMASSAVNALQAAETANLDAQYDARIASAQGNADEVERLETEKAQKKLDIEKKYADVQFAIKASEIIGNTTVAIMTGYAQLGPIMGSIAAVMLGVTGAAQLVAANAERQKIKSMTLGGSGGKGAGSGRVVAQRAQGKYDVIGEEDGRMYRNVPYAGDAKTGIVSRPTLMGERGAELVVSSPDFKALQKHINYPVVLQALQDVRFGTTPQRAGGKYDEIDRSITTVDTKSDRVFSDVDREMLQLLRQLNKPGAITTNLSLGAVQNGLNTLDKENDKFRFGDK